MAEDKDSRKGKQDKNPKAKGAEEDRKDGDNNIEIRYTQAGDTVTSNNVVRNPTLSLSDKGLYSILKSYCSIAGWRFNLKHLYNSNSDGMFTIKKSIKNLQGAELLKIFPVRDEKGRIQRWIWEVKEPEVDYRLLEENLENSPEVVYQQVGKATSGYSNKLNTDPVLNKENINKTNINNLSSQKVSSQKNEERVRAEQTSNLKEDGMKNFYYWYSDEYKKHFTVEPLINFSALSRVTKNVISFLAKSHGTKEAAISELKNRIGFALQKTAEGKGEGRFPYSSADLKIYLSASAFNQITNDYLKDNPSELPPSGPCPEDSHTARSDEFMTPFVHIPDEYKKPKYKELKKQYEGRDMDPREMNAEIFPQIERMYHEEKKTKG